MSQSCAGRSDTSPNRVTYPCARPEGNPDTLQSRHIPYKPKPIKLVLTTHLPEVGRSPTQRSRPSITEEEIKQIKSDRIGLRSTYTYIQALFLPQHQRTGRDTRGASVRVARPHARPGYLRPCNSYNNARYAFFYHPITPVTTSASFCCPFQDLSKGSKCA
jgi:hypothetical protein